VKPFGTALRPNADHPAFLVAMPMAAEHLHHIGGVDRDDPCHGMQAAEHRGDAGENRE